MRAGFLHGLIAVCLVLPFPSVRLAGEPAAEIRVDFSPPLEKLTLHQLVNISMTVSSGAAEPVDVSVQLWAPTRGDVFTTDFPLVEGTQLVGVDVRMPNRSLEFGYDFPIRGTYRLVLKAVDAEGSSLERTVLIPIGESSRKWLFLVVFLVCLFSLGVLAGRLFSGVSAKTSRMVAAATLVMLSGLRLSAAQVESNLTVSSARVGSLSTIRWAGAGLPSETDQAVTLTMRIAHLEKNRTVFQLSRPLRRSSYEFRYQFTDAADYVVDATLTLPSGQEIARTAETVHAASDEPMMRDRLIPVLVSLLVVAAGLATGRWSRRRKLRG